MLIRVGRFAPLLRFALAAKLSRRTLRPARPQLELEPLELRCLLSVSGYRPIDEIGNNVSNPAWGTAGTDLVRLSPTYYANGYNSPSLPQDPSARLVSDILNNQADPAFPSQDIATVNQQSLSDFAYSFGQFMDHDMDLTPDGSISEPISVPLGDPIGGPSDTPLAFNRSVTDPATGTGPGNPAQDVNAITSYLDLSQVYGSDQATDDALRTFVGGQMKTSPGGLPPLDNSTYFTAAQLAAINASVGGMQDNGPLPESQMFVTGDSRGNENVELTALQALFLDNHNRIAAQLQQENPTWSDEQLFQEARKINIAEYQSIIYNEWIPDVLGAKALPAYTGYNPNVNASIANEFSTVAFRFGHSLLSGNVERQGNDGLPVGEDVPLSIDFFDPTILNGEGQPTMLDPITGLSTTDIGAILKGDADGNAQAEDPLVINEVRDLLFNEVVPGVGFGQDLIALDVERARDHGIGSYNQLRVALGLPAVTSFAQITSNVQVQHELQQAYGNVNNIDPFEGGLAEDPVAGSDVGPLFQTIMVDQFENLRDGDRFFYLNETWTPQELAIFNQGNTLAKVIENNTEITNLQSDVFIFQASISGSVTLSLGSYLARGVPIPGTALPGVTVHLEDTSGDILATTVTNAHGQFSFNQLSGPASDPENSAGVSGTGFYEIVVVIPPLMGAYGKAPAPILISNSGMNVTGINFELGLSVYGWFGGTSGTQSAVVGSGTQAALAIAATNALKQTTTAPTNSVVPATSSVTIRTTITGLPAANVGVAAIATSTAKLDGTVESDVLDPLGGDKLTALVDDPLAGKV